MWEEAQSPDPRMLLGTDLRLLFPCFFLLGKIWFCCNGAARSAEALRNYTVTYTKIRKAETQPTRETQTSDGALSTWAKPTQGQTESNSWDSSTIFWRFPSPEKPFSISLGSALEKHLRALKQSQTTVNPSISEGGASMKLQHLSHLFLTCSITI